MFIMVLFASSELFNSKQSFIFLEEQVLFCFKKPKWKKVSEINFYVTGNQLMWSHISLMYEVTVNIV